MRLGKAEEGVDGGNGSIDGRGWSGKADIERKLELAANGSNAADNVGAVDGAAVPGISGTMGGFHENFVGGTVVCVNCGDFVQETEEAFNADSFVITACSDMEREAEHGTKAFEFGLESTVGVDNNEAAETNFEEEGLHKNVGKGGCGDVGDSFEKDEPSEVAHCCEDMGGVTERVGGGARAPKVNVKDVERGADRPRKVEFAVAADGAVGEDAVGTLLDPINDVFSHFWPEEAEAEAVQGFVLFGMPGGRGSMVSGEDGVAERGGDND
jgi:hypothetical protein